MTYKDSLDLWAAFLLAAAATVVAAALSEHSSPLRVVLGFLLVLLLPGYSLMALLFPRRTDLSALERWVVSVGLSVSVVTLVGLAFNYLPWGVRTVPVSTGLCLVILVCGLATYRRRQRISPEERFRLVARSPSVLVGAALCAGVTVLIGSTVAATLALRPPAQSTEFYILGERGVLESYPRRIVAGEAFSLTFGLTNYELQPESFIIRARLEANEQLFETPLLEHGESWQDELVLDVPPGFGETTAEFGLYRSGSALPYRRLQLDLEFAPSLDLPELSEDEP